LRASSRKYSDYTPSSKHSPPRASTKPDSHTDRERERARRERERVREKEEQRDRDYKRSQYEQEAAYEEERRRRDRERDADKSKAIRSESAHAADLEMKQKLERAREHMAFSVRPSTRRTDSGSTHEVHRSRARRSGSAERQKDRRVPNLPTHHSSPAKMDIPASMPPRRAYTMQPEDYRDADDIVPPSIRRSETAPVHGFTTTSSSSRRKEPTQTQPSRLRTYVSATGQDSGYSSNSGPGSPDAPYAEIPPPQTKSSTTHRYVIREPGGRSRGKSPSPARYGSSGERPSAVPYTSSRGAHYSYSGANPVTVESRRPSIVRAPATSAAYPTSRRSPEHRGDRDWDRHHYDFEDRPSAKFHYGEVPSPRGSKEKVASYPAEKVSTRANLRPEDVTYTKDFFPRPTLEKSRTYVY